MMQGLTAALDRGAAELPHRRSRGYPLIATIVRMSGYADLSLWHASLGEHAWAPRPALPGDTDVDVAIVGGGLTGLWTAYYLSRSDPALRVAVIEAEVAGFGASGRNGGWCSALVPMSFEKVARQHSSDAAMRMQQAMFSTVDEVGRVAADEGIDCHFAKGGTIDLARSATQRERLQAEVRHRRKLGFTEDDYRWLDADEATTRLQASDVQGAMFTPHCAAVHPSRLTRGLAEAVERRGVAIYERTRVQSFGNGVVVTDCGTVRAAAIIRATEAFTPTLPGERRTVAPVYSLMIATEPLDDDTLRHIGLHERSTFNDARHVVIYGQRTADGRLAFGGRGAPYHFGSAVRPSFDRDHTVHEGLRTTLVELFPILRNAQITHRWGGPVGIPRDWWCSVGFDRARGVGWAGGYVGDGLATTNLAGRTLADLITGEHSELVDLPWVGHRSRRWEPEPLRWLGINTMVRLPAQADAYERRRQRQERWRTALINRFTGG
jgi:glycine/D-amino acid oxidase-like deaminating enzyme